MSPRKSSKMGANLINGIIPPMTIEVARGPEKNIPHAEKTNLTYAGAHIPLSHINVLEQPRQTFENIDELAQSIAINNLLHPLIVARLSPEGCQQYLDTINRLWGREHRMEELTPADGEDQYYILLAGERRFRACKHLDTVGCKECQEAYGEGPCYERHFDDRGVDVRLAQDIQPIQAIFIQASENIHMRVPAAEEAQFYYRLYKTLREQNPDYPVSKFSREVGRSPDTIRTAIRYCLLPSDVQEFVEGGQITYGIATEVARLKTELNMGNEELHHWALRAIANNYRVPDFRELVTNFIKQQKSGQGMLEIFSQEQERTTRRSLIKRTVAKNTIRAEWESIGYLQTVRRLIEDGHLGEDDSPYSMRSPIRVFSALIEEERQLLPHLQKALKKEEYASAEAVLNETQETLDDHSEETDSGSLYFDSVM